MRVLPRRRLGLSVCRQGGVFVQKLMWTIRFKLQSLARNQEGQDLVEYALVLALVSIAAIASLTALDHKITLVFSTIATDL